LITQALLRSTGKANGVGTRRFVEASDPCDNHGMNDGAHKAARRGPTMLAELVGRVLAPVSGRRGFATADLVAAWPDIVGAKYAECTRPQKIAWPRDEDASADGGVLHLTVDGPRAVLIQHELGQIIERINAFLGYAAIARIRIVQGPVAKNQPQTQEAAPLDSVAEARLGAAVAGVEDDGLRAALARLGRGALQRR
jgi:hypothetical protein